MPTRKELSKLELERLYNVAPRLLKQQQHSTIRLVPSIELCKATPDIT